MLARIEHSPGRPGPVRFTLGDALAPPTTLHVSRGEPNAKNDLAILIDISAACGSTVIYDGHRDNKVYQQGAGVCAARLIEAGIPVISQRDFQSLEVLHKHLAPEHTIDPVARDHHKGDWYLGYFAALG